MHVCIYEYVHSIYIYIYIHTYIHIYIVDTLMFCARVLGGFARIRGTWRSFARAVFTKGVVEAADLECPPRVREASQHML